MAQRILLGSTFRASHEVIAHILTLDYAQIAIEPRIESLTEGFAGNHP
jgi:hypothetical protein